MKTIEAINRTITIDDWYAGQKAYPEDFLASHIQTADRDLIARSGFRAVKVNVDTDAMADGGKSLIENVDEMLKPTDTGERLYVIFDFQSAPPDTVVQYLRRDRVLVQISRFGSVDAWRKACPQLTIIKQGGGEQDGKFRARSQRCVPV